MNTTRILLIEADKNLAGWLADILIQESYIVEMAADPQDVFEMLKQTPERYQLVIIRTVRYDVNAIELCTAIRFHGLHNHLLFVPPGELEASEARTVLARNVQIVNVPFTVTGFLDSVKQALEDENG